MYDWLRASPCACVAIFDATNTTRERRAALMKRCRREKGVLLVFVESICEDEGILAQVCARPPRVSFVGVVVRLARVAWCGGGAGGISRTWWWRGD